ncbi:DNA-binding transcriptional LysR family regulator [Sphingomonas zeicaulis]|uniref:hypothetical protein n=1 Tax=Sphingomonas zeicaulis TaxID=1632740 RepID=UPI003D1B6DFB
MNRLLAEAEVVPRQTMELRTREMNREAVAQGIGMSLIVEKECPPDSRIRVLPLATDFPALIMKGYLAARSERKRMPLICRSLAVPTRMAGGGGIPRQAPRAFAPGCNTQYAHREVRKSA